MCILVVFIKYGDILTIHFLQLLDTILEIVSIDIILYFCYNEECTQNNLTWGRIWFRRGYGIRSSESLSPNNVKSGKLN